MIKLRPRLKAITEIMQKCDLLCDIGTDHAYLPIYVLKNNLCEKAIITEINQGPLEIANYNIETNNLGNYVESIFGDGLKPLKDSNFLNENENGKRSYVISIAGMGGILIDFIISKSLDEAKKANSLILQPMNRIEILYEGLIKNGFEIYDERLVKDDGRIYHLLAVRWTGFITEYNTIDLYISKLLINKKDPLLVEYIKWRISVFDKVIKKLKNYKDQNINKDNEGSLNKFENLKSEMVVLLTQINQ